MRRKKAEQYAEAVMRVLVGSFPELEFGTDRYVVANAVMKQATDPSDMFEVIVDRPSSANWRLKSDREHADRVRMSCYRFTPSDADRAREDRINAALREIA